MLTVFTWTHPLHGEVTELLCPAHELPARAALRELGIEYIWRLASDGDPTASQAKLQPASVLTIPAGAGWFQGTTPSPTGAQL
jgi:hypothetical protein